MIRCRPSPATWEHRKLVLLRPYKGGKEQFLPCLYVAGDLDHFQMPALDAMATATDLQHPGSDGRMRIFRRLDAYWLIYLHRRLLVAIERNNLHPTLAARWQAIIAWSGNRWGADRVEQALHRQPDARYRAPAMPAAA